MKAIIPNIDENINKPVYLQLYNHIRSLILTGEVLPGEKLPSLRQLADMLGYSITTIEQAYGQLSVEGYIFSKPGSGYFVSEIFLPDAEITYFDRHPDLSLKDRDSFENYAKISGLETPSMQYDLSSFSWPRWKKCINRVINDFPEQLLFGSDPQGEKALRYEISRYIFESRGVKSDVDQIVVAAGTQQITSHLSNILHEKSIENISVESPGYEPVIKIFRDGRFAINPIPVLDDGIDIAKLPWNIATAVYVNPSNQFPTGTVMPISKRYNLLDWADKNNSYIIEDDYDSELRYFGKPVPALKSLPQNRRVIYLGSFSSTLFPAAKISYMVLPPELAEVFQTIKSDYSQTCSKMEQLALAIFMKEGWYQTGIKKLRKLYSKKLTALLQAISKYGQEKIRPNDTKSGIAVMLTVDTKKTQEELIHIAENLGITAKSANNKQLFLYYNHIPLEKIDSTVESLIKAWLSI